MDEFDLIKTFFYPLSTSRDDVALNIGDDGACLVVPPGYQLVVSTDTMVSGVHFLPEWSAYDIATKACMVNISDMAAMGAEPRWVTLALTIPSLDADWLALFARGMQDALRTHNIALVGGDTTKGPLCITLTIHGVVPNGKAIKRSGAKAGDVVYVTGELGLAAGALALYSNSDVIAEERSEMLQKLHCPRPRVDWLPYIREFATAAIDISDGLIQDLGHICASSQLGASVDVTAVPVHPILKKYLTERALEKALTGGDDYELCITVSQAQHESFKKMLRAKQLVCYPIGIIEVLAGVRVKQADGQLMQTGFSGYRHFT